MNIIAEYQSYVSKNKHKLKLSTTIGSGNN